MMDFNEWQKLAHFADEHGVKIECDGYAVNITAERVIKRHTVYRWENLCSLKSPFEEMKGAIKNIADSLSHPPEAHYPFKEIGYRISSERVERYEKLDGVEIGGRQ